MFPQKSRYRVRFIAQHICEGQWISNIAGSPRLPFFPFSPHPKMWIVFMKIIIRPIDCFHLKNCARNRGLTFEVGKLFVLSFYRFFGSDEFNIRITAPFEQNITARLVHMVPELLPTTVFDSTV